MLCVLFSLSFKNSIHPTLGCLVSISDLAITMAIDLILTTNQEDVICKNVYGSVDVGIMAVNKEVDNLLPTRTLSRMKGKQVTWTTNEIDMNKDCMDNMDEGIIVNDFKRRSQIG